MTNKSSGERVGFLALGVDCAACSPVLRKTLSKTLGVQRVEFDYILNRIYVEYSPEKTTSALIKEAIAEAGFRVSELHR